VTKEDLWQIALSEIELNTSKANFTTWFRNTYIISRKDSGVVISVPNGFSKEWLENKFYKLILRSIRQVCPEIKEVSFLIESKKPQSSLNSSQSASRMKTLSNLNDQLAFEQLNIDKETNLNPKYTFNTFIVGASNEVAHAAACSISENPGREYNPLYIYGGVGLGKTHLLQAVGNKLKDTDKNRKIKYISSEKFTNDFINGLHYQTLKEFREQYRKLDVLIIDDIQFIAKKERTQEEFFHTFNTLYEDNKQIIISSDRPPKSIDSIEDRLRSRFEGGLMVDVGYPDYETRVAILRSKLKEKGAELQDDVVYYLAEYIQSNIRELEGALNILLSSSKEKGADINIEKTKKHLDKIVKKPRRAMNLGRLIKAVSSIYDVSEKDILSQNRKRQIAHPRQVLMYLMREEMKQSFPVIGDKLGGRDHTTVIHAYSKICTALKNNDEQLAEEINLIKREIYIT